jgi:hypothetical protein
MFSVDKRSSGDSSFSTERRLCHFLLASMVLGEEYESAVFLYDKAEFFSGSF